MEKVVLITGASKGIGASLAKKFALNGGTIVITYLSGYEYAKNLEKEISSNGGNILIKKCDITKEEDILLLLDDLTNTFGHVDILINNAALSMDNNYIDKTKSEFMKVLEVNVVGTFLVTKYISKIMNNGIILNISSKDSIDTYSIYNIDYSASKAGVNSLTKSMSLSIPNNKFLSIVLPWVNTEAIKEMNQDYLNSELKRIKQERLIESTEVADKIYEIISANNFPSGVIMNLDGGIYEYR